MGVLIKNIIVKGNRVSAEVFVNEEKNDVWYEFPWNMEEISTRLANALLVAFMPIAMKSGGKFEIDGEISKSLYNQMETYQDIMTKWYSELSRVEICPKKISEDIVISENRKVISCFTGGVDSFHTLIKNKENINDLLYVWGFDIPLTEEAFYAQVQKHMSTVAKAFNKEIVFVKTNLGFKITNKYASWGDFCYGGAIASVVLLSMAEATMAVSIKNNKIELANQLKEQIVNYKSKNLIQYINENFINTARKVTDWCLENDNKTNMKKILKISMRKIKRKFKRQPK